MISRAASDDETPAGESVASASSTFLESTFFLDWESEPVQLFTASAVGDATESLDVAARIFAAVRDRVWYDPYSVSDDPVHYRASYVATAGAAYCVPKAVLLTAVARAAGIPSRLGFCDVRNHLQTYALRQRMGGTDLFVYHGYSELLLDGRWVKATPAFNRELCARFGVEPIDFDGRSDALLHQHSPTAPGTWITSATVAGSPTSRSPRSSLPSAVTTATLSEPKPRRTSSRPRDPRSRAGAGGPDRGEARAAGVPGHRWLPRPS